MIHTTRGGVSAFVSSAVENTPRAPNAATALTLSDHPQAHCRDSFCHPRSRQKGRRPRCVCTALLPAATKLMSAEIACCDFGQSI